MTISLFPNLGKCQGHSVHINESNNGHPPTPLPKLALAYIKSDSVLEMHCSRESQEPLLNTPLSPPYLCKLTAHETTSWTKVNVHTLKFQLPKAIHERNNNVI